VITLVKIHGNWCGPNWTAGQKIPAKKLKKSRRNFKCIDKLDCACRDHDISIKDDGPSFRSDQNLQRAAQNIIDNPLNAIVNPLMYAKAIAVRDVFSIRKFTHRR